MAEIRIKRAYEPPVSGDGYRILVDRLWPRGLSKQQLKIDRWLKDVAPSNELRRWFGHDPAKFAEFKKLYEKELHDNPAVAEMEEVKEPVITLVYSAKDEQHNQAVVLKSYLSH